MDQKQSALTRFIESYARSTASRDIPAIVAHFAETFLVAGPAGAQCVRSADFARVLPRRTELFDSLGCQPAELLSMQHSWLDDSHASVRTTWHFTFLRPEHATETVDSESIFLIDTGTDPHRILLYLTPRDIMDTLRERGILR